MVVKKQTFIRSKTLVKQPRTDLYKQRTLDIKERQKNPHFNALGVCFYGVCFLMCETQ